MPPKTLLLAYPEEWNTLSSGELPADYLSKEGFDVITAFSYADAINVITSQVLSAVVMISDWAMRQEDGTLGLMELLKGNVPTMSLITTTTYRNNDGWMDELFAPPNHEYQHMPAPLEAIVVWLNKMVKEI